MKQVNAILLITLSLLTLSCAKSVVEGVTRADSTRQPATHKVASSDLQNYFVGVKGIVPTKISDISVEPIVNGLDTVMYLVNYEDGWEVLSGDRRLSKTLISSDSGSTTMADINTNPLLASYIDDLSKSIASIEADDSFRTPSEMKDSWERSHFPGDSVLMLVPVFISSEVLDETVLEEQDHLLETKWGQGTPWNQYAPYTSSSMDAHCYTGCVPVAAAQLLYYLHYKIDLPGTIPGEAICTAYLNSPADSVQLTVYNTTFTNYSSDNWDDMPLSAANSIGADKVAALMTWLGLIHTAHYKIDGTNASHACMANDYDYYFDISCEVDFISSSNLTAYLDTVKAQVYGNQLPVVMSVKRTNENIVHEVVIDGYRKLHQTLKCKYGLYEATLDGRILPFQQPVRFIYTTEEAESYWIAINWGWDGQYDSADNGNTIWYNAFGNWIVDSRTYDEKISYVYDFRATNS